VHHSAGWLPLVPALEAKVQLGDHLHDDTRSVTKIRRRLYELRHPRDDPGAPGPKLAGFLDRLAEAATPEAYVSVAYGMVKPALVRAVRVQLAGLDPVTDEPSLRLLTQLLARQERHIEELGPGAPPPDRGPEDLAGLAIRPRATRRLPVLAPLLEPARDPFVEVTDEGDPFLAREL